MIAGLTYWVRRNICEAYVSGFGFSLSVPAAFEVSIPYNILKILSPLSLVNSVFSRSQAYYITTTQILTSIYLILPF